MRKLAIGVLAAAIVIAGCGGSSKKVVGSSNTPTTNKSSTSNTTSLGGALNEIPGVAALAKQKIKITYTDTTSDGGTTTFTIAQDGNGKGAFTSVSDNASSTIYTDGTTTTECEGTGTSANCTALPVASAALATSFTSAFSAIAGIAATLGGGDRSSDTIAGRDASCVKFKASDVIGKLSGLALFKGSDLKAGDYDPNDSATICVDKKTGFVLKLTSTKKGATDESLVATAAGDPSDSDFTPPVTPQTIPSIPNVSLPGGVTIPTVPAG